VSVHRVIRNSMACARSPFALSHGGREIVERAIRDHCNIRQWKPLAISARTTHVHVVLSKVQSSPEQVLQQFKQWSTRRLRSAGELPEGQPAWARHGSTRYLWTPDSVLRAIDYVGRLQGAARDWGPGPEPRRPVVARESPTADGFG
jgi:REP element-mobilizing transposase RayT